MLNLRNFEGWNTKFNSPLQNTGHYCLNLPQTYRKQGNEDRPRRTQQLPYLLWPLIESLFVRRCWFPRAAPPVCSHCPRFNSLHTVSHRRIPREDSERSSRLLLVLRNMKRPMRWAGIAANEQTVGGWLLPPTSAAGGPREGTDE